MTVHTPRNLRIFFGSALATIFLVVATVTLVGCTGKNGSTGKSSKSPTPGKSSPSPNSDPERILKSVFEMCLPERLGPITTVDASTNRINDWLDTVIEQEGISLNLPETILSKMSARFPKEEIDRTVSPRFDHRDIRHLRTQILFQNITARITNKKGTKENDILQDCTDLFYYTMRNVALIEEKDSVPFPPFRIMLWGRGTVADRTWIYASLLKQYTKARVDVVVLQPKTNSSKADPAKILIGVMIHTDAYRGKVFLYDPMLGIPLPAASTESRTSILVDRPATLAEFTTDNTVFTRLKTPTNDYRITPQELKNLTCQLVSDSSFASARSKFLQNSIDKNQDVRVYEKLFAEDKNAEPRKRGLFDRVSHFSSPSWSAGDISLWKYPETTFRRFGKVADNTRIQEKINRIINTFGAPYGTDIIKTQFRSRVAQLSGRYSDALAGYNLVRLKALTDRDQGDSQASESTILNALAADDAMLWSGFVKIEQGNFKSVGKNLTPYGRKQRDSSTDRGHCMFWLGYAQMKNEEFSAGVQALSRIPDAIPLYFTGRYFVGKWRKIRDSQ